MKTLSEIQAFAETNDAVAFDKYCDTNGISNEWLDVTVTDFNDEYYNVYLSDYGVHVMYYNGKLEEFNK
jgi:hypothetical protein